LAALLHDADERAAKSFIDQALESEPHHAVAAALRSVQRYSHIGYRQSTFLHLRIVEDTTIDEGQDATRWVKQWLQEVPVQDLESCPGSCGVMIPLLSSI